MNIVNAIVGIVLLLFGRRLFWFFVAASGFAAGLFFANEHLKLESDALVLAIALLAGLVGALLAFFLQKAAIALAGFAAGGFLGMTAAAALTKSDPAMWGGFVVGGILGAVLLIVVFEWALIILSALVGAALVSDSVIGEPAPALVFVIALVVGICVQALQRAKVKERRSERREGARRG